MRKSDVEICGKVFLIKNVQSAVNLAKNWIENI
jgi:hypothetical protein